MLFRAFGDGGEGLSEIVERLVIIVQVDAAHAHMEERIYRFGVTLMYGMVILFGALVVADVEVAVSGSIQRVVALVAIDGNDKLKGLDSLVEFFATEIDLSQLFPVESRVGVYVEQSVVECYRLVEAFLLGVAIGRRLHEQLMVGVTLRSLLNP